MPPAPTGTKKPATPVKGTPGTVKPSVAGGEPPESVVRSSNLIYMSVGKTINIGNYETIRADFGMQIQVPAGKTHAEVREENMPELIKQFGEMVTTITESFETR